MKKLMFCLIQIKNTAPWIFAVMVCLYMAGGALYNSIYTDPLFTYAIPFIFLIEGLVLSVLISVLYGVFFGDEIIKKWRYFPRLVLFCVSLIVLLVLSVLVFYTMPTFFAKLWWLVIGCAAAGIALLSVIAECHFRITGKRYTEILKNYKADIS